MSTPYSRVSGIGDVAATHSWNPEHVKFEYVWTGDDAEYGPSFQIWEIDARDHTEAEKRILRYIEVNFDDDMRGAVAASQGERVPGRYRVRIDYPAGD